MTILLSVLLLTSLSVETDRVPEFSRGKPVWVSDGEEELNQFVGFRAVFEASPGQEVVLRVAAANVYRAWINGRFVGYGPARGPHGWHRVDEWNLSDRVDDGASVVALEVAGYQVDNYYLPNQPPFIQAEVLVDGHAVAATRMASGIEETGAGTNQGGQAVGFTVVRLPERVRKVQRYSFQRPFSEVYRLRGGYDAWRHVGPLSDGRSTAECVAVAAKRLLPRRVSYPRFVKRPAHWQVASGTLESLEKMANEEVIRPFAAMGLRRGGFPVEALEEVPVFDLAKTRVATTQVVDRPLPADACLDLNGNGFHILDFGTNLTGFVGMRVRCPVATRLCVTFDEILSEGDVDWTRMSCANVVSYDLAASESPYELESFEPYTLRYLKLMVLDGQCEIENVFLREYANPDVWEAHFCSSDPRLNRLFAAGRETFRQNALDVFMDCPSRERAGWLCDSFFTSRAALDFSGHTAVERNFFENFLLPSSFKHLPDGMLPMCYPADHREKSFIPNWALWFVVELEEYVQRSGDRAMVAALRPKVERLFNYFKGFRNDDGLLQGLEGWVFIEWSDANKYVQDVNYPSNMLYAGALSAAGRLYGRADWRAEADRIRELIRKQAFDGTFFIDNAVVEDGGLKVTANHTETCQYYAFYFDVAKPDSHDALWRLLCEAFGPNRDAAKVFPDVAKSNAFIGNVLRLELLSRYGRCRQLCEEAIDYHLYMADRTGTLWENVHDRASCNHGFASHLVHLLYRDVLGIRMIDPVAGKIELWVSDLPMDWCEGRIPLASGAVGVRWWKDAETIRYRLDAPAGFAVKIEDRTGGKALRMP